MQLVYNAFATLSANGQTAALAIPFGAVIDVDVMLATGGATFGSGTLKLQVSPDGGTTWMDAPAAAGTVSWTAGTAGARLGTCKGIRGTHIRFDLAGATSPTLIPVVTIEDSARCVAAYDTISNGQTDSLPLLRVADDGKAYLFAKGTFASTVVSLQASPDAGTTWFVIDSLSAAGLKALADLKPEWQYRIAAVGGTGTGLSWYLFA